MFGNLFWIDLNMHSCLILAWKQRMLLAQKGIDPTIGELGKLVYAAHGYSLVFYKRPLYPEENEYWNHGPSPSWLMKSCGTGRIYSVRKEDTESISPEDEEALIWALKLMDHPQGLDLVTMGFGSPWVNIHDNIGFFSPRRSLIIDDEDTRSHFIHMV